MESLLGFIKQYKLVIAAVLLIVASLIASTAIQHQIDTKPVVRGDDPTVGACGPPACPAHRAKDPNTGSCTIPC
ncbi:MAG: hypothetical protein ACXWUF_15050 [Methylomagnum sp.]